MDTCPPVPIELIDTLEKLYPERCADLSWTDREVWFRSGQRQVVRFLREQFDRQNRNILETHPHV